MNCAVGRPASLPGYCPGCLSATLYYYYLTLRRTPVQIAYRTFANQEPHRTCFWGFLRDCCEGTFSPSLRLLPHLHCHACSSSHDNSLNLFRKTIKHMLFFFLLPLCISKTTCVLLSICPILTWEMMTLVWVGGEQHHVPASKRVVVRARDTSSEKVGRAVKAFWVTQHAVDSLKRNQVR